MDPFERNVDGYYDVEPQLPRYLRQLADQQFDAAERERAAISTRADAESRATAARQYFFDALGGLPETRPPLNPVRTGTLARDGYRVELVAFESLPDFHVTANLYLPTDANGPMPGVLFFCGHADVGKAAPGYQQACIDLVTNGFVVLAVDPIGQGERHQFHDPETGETPRRNLREHTYLGHQCTLAGTNLARYFVWDAMRSLDYLAGRPEVDAERIGATGNSGGGMQTGYLMLADDRLAAAAPCCFVTSKEEYMKTGQAQDGEQILWRAIDRGPRYDDFLSGFAPKPVRIGASQSDFLCIEGATRSYERARAVYDLYDAANAIDLTVSPTTHGLDPVLREAVVNWFREQLHDDPPTFETGDPEPEPPERLTVLDGGEVNAAFPDERHVVDLTREYLTKRTMSSLRTHDDESDVGMQALVRERFDLDRETVELFPRCIEEHREGGLTWEKVFFRSEADVVTTGIVVRDEAVSDAAIEPTVVLLPHGTDDLPEYRSAVASLAAQQGVVLVFDPRGVGGVRARDVNTPLANGGEYYDYHGTEYKLASDALMLGTSLVALRVFDVLRARAYLRERFGDLDLGVVGAGTGAVLAAYAAIADPAFRTVVVDDVPSYEDRATDEETRIDHSLIQFDVVGVADLPQLHAALADRDLTVDAFPENGFP